MAAVHAVRPWHGRVFRHIPGNAPFDPLDTRFAGHSNENRWNRPGEPTLYFAGDRSTLIAEFANHFERNRSPELAELVQTRRVFELEIALSRVYDLTSADAVAELGLGNDPKRFQDRAVTRATAGFLRDVLEVEGLIAPSIPLLAHPEHRTLVLFLDRLESPLSEIVQRMTPAGSFQLVPSLPVVTSH